MRIHLLHAERDSAKSSDREDFLGSMLMDQGKLSPSNASFYGTRDAIISSAHSPVRVTLLCSTTWEQK